MPSVCFDKSLAKEIADDLMQIKAIKLQPEDPYTWASGWKSPIYCDNRLSLSHPLLRDKIKNSFCDAIQKEFAEAEIIAGVATAGIPQGALIADKLGLPFVYVRSQSKSHGLENLVEGELTEGKKVVVVEDLISTGGSSLKAVEAIRQANCEVLGIVSIFTYSFYTAENNLNEKGVKLLYLSDYPTLIELAIEKGYIDNKLADTLNDWRMHPSGWGKIS